MPNWIVSTVKVTERIEDFKKEVLNDEEVFDLNKIEPMPEDLNLPSGTNGYIETDNDCLYDNHESLGYFHFHICKNLQPILDKCYNDDISQDDFVSIVCEKTERNPEFEWVGLSKEQKAIKKKHIPLKARGYWNLQKYGHVDWYSWRNQNWGTKLNTCETYISETGTSFYVSFRTAWDTPFPIWETLAIRGFTFEVTYADEDYGSNLGIITVSEEEGMTHDVFSDIEDLDERRYLSDLIYNGVESSNWEDPDYGFDKIPKERQEELMDMISPYLM